MERPTLAFVNPTFHQELAGMHDEWLIPGILPSAGLVILASPPKSGKTCLATALSYAVANGTPDLGRTPKQGTVLWCAYEESMWERMALHEPVQPETPFLVSYRDALPPIDGRLSFELFEDTLQKYRPKLLVIDPLHAAVANTNLADNTPARRIMQRLKDTSYEFGCTVLVLHHVTKSATRTVTPDRFADSAQIIATASCHLFLETGRPSGDYRRWTLHGEGRHPVPESRINLRAKSLIEFEIDDERGYSRQKSSIDLVCEALASRQLADAQELAEHTGLQIGTVRNALTRLTRIGAVALLPKDARAAKYAFVEP